MLILNPASVMFDGEPWEDVSAVAVDRLAARALVEWGDLGSYVAFCDVPEQRVEVTVARRLLRDDPDGPEPGQAGELSFVSSPSRSDAGRVRVRVQAVILEVRTELSEKAGAVRRVKFVAVSGDGGESGGIVIDVLDGGIVTA